ncbi:MAG: 3',5'-cyclic-AMP phosphodiesterase, partial [Haemophilus parainfluenzae]
MSNTFEYEPANEVVKLLQITDPHLFKDTSKHLLGINTHESYSQVLKEIQSES